MYLGSVLGGTAQGINNFQASQLQDAALKKQQYDLEQQRVAKAKELALAQYGSGVAGQLFAPPPVSQPMGQGPQPPMPGQASQPMAPPGGQPQVPMGMDQGAQQAPVPAVPPYQTVQGAAAQRQAAPQPSQPQMMAPPSVGGAQPQAPAQQPQQGNGEITVGGIVSALRQQNVPQEYWMDVINQYAPIMNAQNKQEALMLKQQLDVAKLGLQQQNTQSLVDYRARKGGGAGGTGGGGGTPGLPKGATPDGIRAETYSYLINNVSPPKRTGEYSAVMSDIAKLAKENNMSTEDLISAGADIKSRVMAKRSFEVRTQNLTRAENQLSLEIPVMEDAMKALSPSNIPALANLQLSAIRQGAGGKEAMANVRKLDQAAQTVFNEFEGIITGNPGTLNVQDVNSAKEQYKSAQTPAQMQASIAGMKRIIANAKQANDMTRKEIMGGVQSALRGGSNESNISNTNAKGWTLHTDAKGNKAYVSPDGKQFEEVK